MLLQRKTKTEIRDDDQMDDATCKELKQFFQYRVVSLFVDLTTLTRVASHETGKPYQLHARHPKLELQNFRAIIVHYTGSAVDTKQRHFLVLIRKAITPPA